VPSAIFAFSKHSALTTEFDCGVFGVAKIVKQLDKTFKVTLPGRTQARTLASEVLARDFVVSWFQAQVSVYSGQLSALRNDTMAKVRPDPAGVPARKPHPATCRCHMCQMGRVAVRRVT
jgi:hypothetical protein